MLSKAFVQEYLRIKDLLKYKAVTETKYRILMSDLCKV